MKLTFLNVFFGILGLCFILCLIYALIVPVGIGAILYFPYFTVLQFKKYKKWKYAKTIKQNYPNISW